MMSEAKAELAAEIASGDSGRQFVNDDYTVGWICAITTEHVAARVFLDEEHGLPDYQSPNDNNSYVLGRVGKHNIVIAVLPYGEYGLSSAASVARDMLHTFPNIRIGLMVGIGGGAPSEKHDIRLGDVVVSVAHDGNGCVFQYDFGKTIQSQTFQQTGFLNQAPMILRTAVSGLESQYEINEHQIEETIDGILNKIPTLRKKYKRPNPDTDRLYRSDIIHSPAKDINCSTHCGNGALNLIVRSKRDNNENDPIIHYGLIASSNQLMRNAEIRDKLAAERDILCFETEAAGLMNHFPCLAIRGICDYADTHANAEWRGYAAMVAAAYAKDLLCRIPPNRVEVLQKMDILSDISEGVNGILHKQKNEHRNVILKWLTPINYASQQQEHFSSRQPETGQWLLDSSQYQTWLNTPAEMLFCQGIPGAGKTILTSMAIDQLITNFQDDMDTGIAYIYFDYRQKEETAERLLRNLLKQLAQRRRSLPTCVSAMYKQDTDRGIPPSLEAISLALQTVAGDYSKTFIIIDALDECTNSNDCRMRFLEEILNLRNKSAANIFATSRPNTEIANRFKGGSFIEISARAEDIRRYINGNMDHLLSDCVRNDVELRTEIEKAIVSSVQGMFLLAKLHLNSLTGKFTIKDIQNTLEKLSVGSEAYDDAYKGMMRRIDSQDPQRRELARRVLSWIVYAKRPLSTTELQQALAVEHWHHELDNRNFTSIEDIVSVCAGLVTTVRQSDQPSGQQSSIVRLVHYTAQDYFERTQAEWFPNAESEITNSCITYLSFSVFHSGFCATEKDFEERLASNPFYNYAAHNWGYHAQNITPLPQQAIAFIGCDAEVQASSQVLMTCKPTWKNSNYSQQFPKKIVGQHLAAYFGIRELFGNTLDGRSLDADDGFGRTPLSYAAGNGHEMVVKFLLQEDTVHPNSRDDDGQTPLMWAAKSGHYATTELLLITDGIDASVRDRLDQTALLLAVKKGHESVVELLLPVSNTLLNAGDDRYQTPLWWSVRNGDTSITRLLLDVRDVNINTKNHYDQTPLWWAARNGDEELISLLLEREELNVNFKDKEGHSPLGRAAQKGHEAVVKLLLAKGDIDVNSADHYGHTPVLLAARNGYAAVVKLLLDFTTVDVNAMDKSGRNPLLWAVKNGHKDVVVLLLSHFNINVNDKDYNDQSPLLYATTYGYESIVQELLAIEGIDVNAKDSYHQTPLLCAAERGHEEIVKMLLAQKDIDITATDRYHQTPLWWAAANGNKSIVKLLLGKQGVDINAKNAFQQTPLLWAARNGNEAITELLLSVPGIDVNVKDNDGLTPLWWAIKKVYKAVVQLLLDNENVDVNHRNDMYQTPLLYVAMEGYAAIVELLIARSDTDVNARDRNEHTSLELAMHCSMGSRFSLDEEHESREVRGEKGGSRLPPTQSQTTDSTERHKIPLPWEARKRYEAVFKLLLTAHKINANARDNYGQTPLLWAAKKGHEGLVKILLETEGIDVNQTDDSNKSPLLWATAENHTAVVQLLFGNNNLILHAEDESRRSPLWWAIEMKNEVVVELLLLREDVNVRKSINQQILRKASDKGNRRILELLISTKHIDINEEDDEGLTFLLWATKGRKAVTVELLLALNPEVDVNAEDYSRQTSLWWAVENGDEEIARLLLTKDGIDVNARNMTRQTPLVCAIRNMSLSIVKLLLKNDTTDVNGKDSFGRSPLLLAEYYRQQIRHSRSKDARYLGKSSPIPLEATNQPDDPYIVHGHGPIEQSYSRAAGYTSGTDESTESHKPYEDERYEWYESDDPDNLDGNMLLGKEDSFKDIIELLLARSDIDTDTTGPENLNLLWAALIHRDMALIKLLVTHKGVNSNSRNNFDETPLLWAVSKGDVAMVKTLLSYGSSVDINALQRRLRTFGTALLHAVRKNYTTILKVLLIQDGIDLNARDIEGCTSLSVAVMNENEGIVKVLLRQKGIDINTKDDEDCTPLMHAMRKQNAPIAKSLLAIDNINVNMADRHDRTPIWYATKWDEELIQLLIKRGAQIDYTDKSGQSLLSWFAQDGNKVATGVLLTMKDIAINIRDKKGGKTPLFHAAEKGHEKIVKQLLERNCGEINSRDESNQTPLLVATSQGHTAVVDVLLGEKSIDLNAQDSEKKTCLWLAAQGGYVKIVELLLSKNINVNPTNLSNQTALSEAVRQGHVETVKLLLASESIDINIRDEESRTALWWAVKSNSVKRPSELIVELLLAHDDIGVNIANKLGQTPLLDAVTRGFEKIVRLLLATDGIDVNTQDDNKLTPLLSAAEEGEEVIAELLLARGVKDINAKNKDGETSLFLACSQGYQKLAEMLLAQKYTDVNSENREQSTPLIIASAKRRLPIVQRLLIQENIQINSRDRNGRSALQSASINGDWQIVQLLLDQKNININTRDNDMRSSLHSAAANGHLQTVQLLLNQKNININTRDKEGQTPLQSASVNGHLQIVQLLLSQKDTDVSIRNNEGETTLQSAAAKGQLQIVQLLLNQKDIDVNDKANGNSTLLHSALKNGHFQIFQLLLDQNDISINIKDNNNGWTLLHLASANGHLRIVQLLLDQKNIDANAKDIEDNTSLHLAANNGHLQIIQLLLRHNNVDINSETHELITPLHLASRKGYHQIVQLLLSQNKVNTEVEDYEGLTPLHMASRNGHFRVVQILLSQSTKKINSKDSTGSTPMHYASENGYFRIVKLLLGCGANTAIRDNLHWTALHFASAYGHFKIAKLLCENGADIRSTDLNGWTPKYLALRNRRSTVADLFK